MKNEIGNPVVNFGENSNWLQQIQLKEPVHRVINSFTVLEFLSALLSFTSSKFCSTYFHTPISCYANYFTSVFHSNKLNISFLRKIFS
ncbi:hypothetical protein ECG_07800 [Echinococcus granulosus]|uniref:Uncharacterized protein n=1 Tax=Echinococcus granulosus TaxID=6210 RepID=A0A068WXF8_ECHGR|nr:hypothetical protein ECG_07800 [Echinococcus granulosus]CDS22323.1 hypothetical protein EgrG_000353000 [Echinococcus granulosus]